MPRDLFKQAQKTLESGLKSGPESSLSKLCLFPLQFMDDEEFVDTVKGFSTVRKEHTMFTDTNL